MKVVLRLYVSKSPASKSAVRNARQIIDQCVAPSCTLEIIQIDEQPDRAMSDRIMFIPTLVKVSPPPICKVIGDLSDRDSVVRELGLESAKSDATVSTGE